MLFNQQKGDIKHDRNVVLTYYVRLPIISGMRLKCHIRLRIHHSLKVVYKPQRYLYDSVELLYIWKNNYTFCFGLQVILYCNNITVLNIQIWLLETFIFNTYWGFNYYWTKRLTKKQVTYQRSWGVVWNVR